MPSTALGLAAVVSLFAASAQAATVHLGVRFDATSQFDNFFFDGAFRPPHAMGAIGTTQFLETSNGSITVYDRTNGTVVLRQGANAFWLAAGQTGTGGNQRVLFDLHTNRWVMSSFCRNLNEICIAVSDTSDALGTWRSTKIAAQPTGNFADYPTLGLDEKGVYIGTNNFDPSFLGTSLFSIPKADLLDGAPSLERMTRFDSPLFGVPDTGFTLQGAINWQANPADRASILASAIDTFDLVSYRLDGVDDAGATRSAIVDVNAQPYTFNNPGRQPDGTRLVDTLDDRFSAAVYEVDGRVYGVHTVTPTGVPTASARTELRWYVLDATTGTLLQQGTIGGDGYDYYQGSIAVNALGQAVIGYNRSGLQTADENLDGLPDGRISFLAQAFLVDSMGLAPLGEEILLRVSDVDDYRCGRRNGVDPVCRQRWGDTSAVSLDPLDPNSFWLIGSHAAEWSDYGAPGNPRSNWQTSVAQLRFSSDVAVGVDTPAPMALLALGVAAIGALRRHRRMA